MIFIYKKLYEKGFYELYNKLKQKTESSVNHALDIDIKMIEKV